MTKWLPISPPHGDEEFLRELQLHTSYDFSSTQIQLPDDLAARIVDFIIDPADLSEKGREDDIHVTTLYGLPPGSLQEVEDLVEDWGAVNFKLGRTGMWPTNNEECLFINVEGEDLHRLHKLLCTKLENEDTHTTYKPHITIAYLKPGTAVKYVGRTEFEHTVVRSDELLYSGADGERTAISLATARS